VLKRAAVGEIGGNSGCSESVAANRSAMPAAAASWRIMHRASGWARHHPIGKGIIVGPTHWNIHPSRSSPMRRCRPHRCHCAPRSGERVMARHGVLIAACLR